ncbi:S41 family peptidase [Streptomyces sp. KLOTTS4A1]|uniref:S41 family peptidase n=1 Tax=Streptomyces sp. KLOTTS4A1 TaxID=3390996 RepID=UPI0039F4D792
MACVLAFVGGCTGSKPSPGADMSPEARSYLSEVLDIMEERALRRDDVDWAEVRKTAFEQAGAARRPSDTYSAIITAVRALGDGHSRFYGPRGAMDLFGDSPNRVPVEGRALPDRIGYLSLPRLQGSDKVLKQYVREGRAAVAKANKPKPCGWVIDLRRNSGGNLWPMLAVVGPVLGDGDVGGFVDARGRRSVWSLENGSPRVDGESKGWGPSEAIGAESAPVAVLHGRATASSGEAVAVAFRGRPATRSFGDDTHGVPTANVVHRLSDGALLNLTEAKMVDRTGRAYDSPIAPDEVVVDNRGRSIKQDPVLEAATAWLSGQPSCE